MKTIEYKDTEVGRIPVDWEVVVLRDIGSFSKGNGISREDSNTGSIPAIRYGDLYVNQHNYIREYKSHISVDIARTARRIHKGDILFTASGETKEDIGKSVAVVKEEEAYAGGDLIVLSPNRELNPIFMGYLTNTEYVRKQKETHGQGDAVVHITAHSIGNIKVALPPLEEQNGIASLISETDNLIIALDKKIEKKRLVKEGLMQQLLTRKTRLPGYDGEWTNTIIGDCVSIGNGKDYKHLSSGTVPVFGTGGIMTYVSDYLYEGPTVCIGRKGTIDRPQYHEGKIWTVDTLFYTYDFRSVLPKFMYYLFCRINWQSYNEATGVPSLTSQNIAKIPVKIPTYEEQVEITTILSDADTEIQSLEAERDKYILIKQGMMQELLTGKTRLI